MDKLLTVPQAAERLACSRYHVYDLIAAGKLRRYAGGLNGDRTRLSEADVQAYIQSIEMPVPAKASA